MEFLKWLLSAEHIFTLATVIISGLISWFLSAHYFKKSNKSALLANVLFPMKQILDVECNWKNYKILCELARKYEVKYLSGAEQKTIDELLTSYREACQYNYDRVCAESLFSYFCYKLRKKEIDPKPVPIEYDGEIVDYDYPPDLSYMSDNLAKIIALYPPDYDETECEEKVKIVFNQYCKQCFTDDKLTYFDDYNLGEVLSKAKVHHEWEQKLADYESNKNNFLNLSEFQKCNK